MRWWRRPWIRFLNRLRRPQSSRLAVALMQRWIEEASIQAIAERSFLTGETIFAESSPSGDLVDHEGNIVVHGRRSWRGLKASVSLERSIDKELKMERIYYGEILKGVTRTPGVYCIKNKVTGKVYVGSSRDMGKRLREHIQHLTRSVHGNPYLQKARNKVGINAFTFKVLEHVNLLDDLERAEQHWMDKLKVCDRKKGYNLCPKAYSPKGFHHGDEAKAKISAARKGKKLSLEHRERLSHSRLGKPGRFVSVEERQRMSMRMKGQTPSEETRRKYQRNSKDVRPPKRFVAKCRRACEEDPNPL